MRDENVRTSFCHLLRLLDIEDVRRRQQFERSGFSDHVDLEIVRHARLLKVGAERPVDQTHGGEVLHAGKAKIAQLGEKGGDIAEGVCSADTGEDGCVFDHGEDLFCLSGVSEIRQNHEMATVGEASNHVDYNVIRITVRHQPRKGSPAGHAEPAAIVDDDQIAAAGLDELGGQADARAGANNGLTGVDALSELLEDLLPVGRRHGDVAVLYGLEIGGVSRG